MEEPIVRLIGVTKTIGRRPIIQDLTLDIPSGQVFGFLGPNGSGKTTTIRMMVGLMSLTKGDILIGGYSIRNEYEKAAALTGAIVENPEMYKFLSGYKNLVHYARMMPGITEERIREVVELVGLKDRIYDKVKTYSLGMRQRLGVAQALLHKPRLLILDEPTNGLDPQGIRELRDYLRRLSRTEGTTIFVSSHLLSEMELMCDSVAIIREGKLVDIRQLRTLEGERSYEETAFEVDDPLLATRLLESHGPRVEGARVLIQGDRDLIADMNAELVRGGVKVYAIQAVTTSLEDQFLQITKTGSEGYE